MRRYVDSDTLESLLTTKRDVATSITNAESVLVLSDNTEYRLTDISSLTLQYPDSNFEVWMRILFSSTKTISVILPSETRYIGAAPIFSNGQTWEISIKDGVAICWRVE